MKITSEDHDRITIVNIIGDLTVEQVDAFRRNMSDRLGNRGRDFVLQIEGMSFVDSAGLEALLWLQDEAARELGQVRLVGPTESVAAILAMTRLVHQFECHDETTKAIKSLR